MTKPADIVFPISSETADSAYYSGYFAGFHAVAKKAEDLATKVRDLQAEIERCDRTVMGLEVDLAIANAQLTEMALSEAHGVVICTETDPDLLQAAKSILSLLDLMKGILHMHGSDFPVTENLAVLNLKTAIRKAEGLE